MRCILLRYNSVSESGSALASSASSCDTPMALSVKISSEMKQER